MSDVPYIILTRAQLAEFLPNQRAIIAFENALKAINTTLSQSDLTVLNATIAAVSDSLDSHESGVSGIHGVSGDVVGTTDSQTLSGKVYEDPFISGGGGNLHSSAWTPNVTGITNVAASTAYECIYSVIGEIVHVAGFVAIDPTGTGNTEFTLSLPVSSVFSLDGDAAGTFSANDFTNENPGAILADTVGGSMLFRYIAKTTGNTVFSFSGMYRIR